MDNHNGKYGRSITLQSCLVPQSHVTKSENKAHPMLVTDNPGPGQHIELRKGERSLFQGDTLALQARDVDFRIYGAH